MHHANFAIDIGIIARWVPESIHLLPETSMIILPFHRFHIGLALADGPF